jgi:hypothetical protein
MIKHIYTLENEGQMMSPRSRYPNPAMTFYRKITKILFMVLQQYRNPKYTNSKYCKTTKTVMMY